jgi:pimeloyl-ACP methyl ester carboxylesterase
LLKLARSSNRPFVHRLSERPKVRRAMFRQAFERGDLISNAEMTEMFADLAACTILDGLLEHLHATGMMTSIDIADDVPVRIAWPMKDRTIPFERYGRPWLRLLPKAELVRLTGVGHVPMYDDPALVVRTILDVTTKADAAS